MADPVPLEISDLPDAGLLDGTEVIPVDQHGVTVKTTTGALIARFGIPGNAGADGADGVSGSVWRSGAGVPDNAVGNDGDLYLDTDTENVYQRTFGAYGVITNIQGSTGASGSGTGDVVAANFGSEYASNKALLRTNIGLGVVDNTADVSKPVSTAQQTALNLKPNAANSALSGVATMAAGSLVSGGLSMTGGGLDPLNRLHLQNSYTLTATPTSWTIGTPLWLETNVVLNNPGIGLLGPQPSGGGFLGPAGQISFSGTTQYNVSAPSVFSFPPIVMLDAQIIKNQPGQNRTISPAWSVLMCKTLIADNGTITLRRPDSTPGWFPFNDSQILVTGTTTTGTGTIDGVTNSVWMGSFMSTPFTFGNTHLYRRVGFYTADLNEYRPDGSTDSSDGYRTQFVNNGTLVSADAGPGVVDQNIGVLIDYMDGGTLNVGLWNGSGTVEPAQSQVLAAGSTITVASTNLDLTTAGGTADVTLTTNPWITAGADGQRVRINSNNTTGKITLTNGHGAIFTDGLDLILMPGSGVNLEYKAVFGTWVEPTFRTARQVYNPNMSAGGAYRLRSTGTNAGALEFRTADTDTNPVASYGMAGATAGAWGFGPGGASTLDYSFARTNTATATVTGTTIMATTCLKLGGVTSAALGEANLGLATLTNHGLILGAGAGAFTALALDASTTKYLKSGGSSAGPSWGTINVTDIPTAAPLASPVFTTASDGSAPIKVWDGTSAHGSIKFGTSFSGLGIQGFALYGADGDTQPNITLVSLSGTGTSSIEIGPGGSTSTDIKIARTGAGTATVTGAWTFTSPVLVTPAIGVATGTSFAATGKVTSSGTAGIGYATGAGGTSTQPTSKATAFPTISKTCGTLTWNNAALAADTTVTSASSTNTTIAATDVVSFMHISGGTLGAYNMTCTPGAGTWTLTLRNLTPGSLSEAPVFAYVITKAVTS